MSEITNVSRIKINKIFDKLHILIASKCEIEIPYLPIPFIKGEKQIQIAAKIEVSFALKKESERLLEVAKQAVEMAIEKGEKEAMGFLENIIKQNLN